MRQETKGRRIKQAVDILIIICGIVVVCCAAEEARTWNLMVPLISVVAAGMAWVLYDIIRLWIGSKKREKGLPPEGSGTHGIQKAVLLDENGKPIKSWDLQGKISQIIGKAGRDLELDIDLSDCEYSSFIDFQHAVLNFCRDQWYVEDLGSRNGIKIRKAEDGECYKVIHRPCRVAAGDILYIANTKLLLT